MSFDWMDVSHRSPGIGRFREQFHREIRERAQLLCNLKYSESTSVRRIQAALQWEFDTSVGSTRLPRFYGDVADIVATVYLHNKGKPRATPKARKSTKRSTKKKRS